MNPSRDGKENVLVLIDAFSMFSQAFVTPNQKTLIMAKIIVDKWFYVYGIPTCIHSDKGWSFENEILEHLCTLYGVKQSTTMPYNPHGNSTCERFNYMLHDLLETLDKEQKPNWPFHLSSLVFAYNATLHSVTGYQPYELVFGCKAPTVCNTWLGLAKYNDQYCKARVYGWMNSMNSSLLQISGHWRASSKQPRKECSVWGGSTLYIPKDNLVLLRDHLEGRHNIQDNTNLNYSLLYQSIRTLMYKQFIQCVGVWCIQSISDNCLTLRNHPLGIVGILIPQIHPLKLIYPFTNWKDLNKTIWILPINIHMAPGLSLGPTLYSRIRMDNDWTELLGQVWTK